MNTKIAISVLILAILVTGGLFYLVGYIRDGKQILPLEAQDRKATSKTENVVDQLQNETPQVDQSTRQFSVVAANYSFDPQEIRVKVGDKVRISFQSSQGSHSFALDEFNVKTPQITPGEEITIQFSADKTGVFEYYCPISNHREMGMVGQLIVE